MNRLLYFVKQALGGMRAAPFGHAVAALTIAVALVLSGVVGALALQAHALLGQWGLRAEITVYLSPQVQAAEAEYLAKQAAEISSGTARYVTSQQAMTRLAAALGEDGATLADLPADTLPASVEVVPAVGTTAEQVEVLALALAKLPGVLDVDYGSAWIERITGLSTAAGVVGLTLLPIILLGAAVLAGSVVRLAIHARAAEIDIQRLVGATNAFVRMPFLFEGFFAGLVGGVLGAAGLLALARYVGPALHAALPLPPELQATALAGPIPLLLVVAAGTLLGLVSSAISVGRHLR